MKQLGVDHNNARFARKADADTAGKVSERAIRNMEEFLAEVRAARMAGRRFNQDVLDLYERLGGS
jgi:hypothetical protein